MARLWDRTRLLDEYSEDMDILREVVRVFLANTPGRLNKLMQSVGSSDYPEARLQVHTLKGSFKLFFARSLVEECKVLESALSSKGAIDRPLLTRKLRSLQGRYAQFAGELTGILENSSQEAS